jgi:hypothetical protein
MSDNNPTIIAWRCWYSDGSTETEYASTLNTFDDLPDEGFQAMRLWYSADTGRYISGNDNYYFVVSPSETIVGQTNDLPDAILEEYPTASIKQGLLISDVEFNEIIQTMINSTIPQ